MGDLEEPAVTTNKSTLADLLEVPVLFDIAEGQREIVLGVASKRSRNTELSKACHLSAAVAESKSIRLAGEMTPKAPEGERSESNLSQAEKTCWN